MAASDTMVQYIVLRKDLLKDSSTWNLGAMIAQGCHVVTKVLWELKEEENVIKYVADMDNMHKVTLCVEDTKQLSELENKLASKGLKYRTWLEKPDNEITALATMPYPRSEIQSTMSDLKLLSNRIKK